MTVELAGIRVAFFIDPPPTNSQVEALLVSVSDIDSVETSGAAGYFVVLLLEDMPTSERIKQAIREIYEVYNG